MRTTADGIAIIKQFEGCHLTAYQDQGGRWTIGWGTAQKIRPGETITQEEADAWLLRDVEFTEKLVLNSLRGVILNDNRLSALVSFVYNVGMGCKGVHDGFHVLANGDPSTMRKLILAGDFQNAADEFPKWDRIAGKAVAGLFKRRLAERDLFSRAA